MTQAELEAQILEVLGRFNSLEFEGLCQLLLMERGRYSVANDELLKMAVRALLRRGEIDGRGILGPLWMPKPKPAQTSAASGRQATLRRSQGRTARHW